MFWRITDVCRAIWWYTCKSSSVNAGIGSGLIASMAATVCLSILIGRQISALARNALRSGVSRHSRFSSRFEIRMASPLCKQARSGFRCPNNASGLVARGTLPNTCSNRGPSPVVSATIATDIPNWVRVSRPNACNAEDESNWRLTDSVIASPARTRCPRWSRFRIAIVWSRSLRSRIGRSFCVRLIRRCCLSIPAVNASAFVRNCMKREWFAMASDAWAAKISSVSIVTRSGRRPSRGLSKLIKPRGALWVSVRGTMRISSGSHLFSDLDAFPSCSSVTICTSAGMIGASSTGMKYERLIRNCGLSICWTLDSGCLRDINSARVSGVKPTPLTRRNNPVSGS